MRTATIRDLIDEFNIAVPYAHFDAVSPAHPHSVTLDYALLRDHRAHPEKLSVVFDLGAMLAAPRRHPAPWLGG